MTKQEVRSLIRARLSVKPSERKAMDSSSACSVVMSSGVWADSKRIMIYEPMADELDVTALLDAPGKEIYVPLITGPQQMIPVLYGTGEPLPEGEGLDLIIVPGRAFDLFGNRLGRGKGYYDRFLARNGSAAAYGIAFSEQILEQIPLEEHDVALRGVFTPDKLYE